MRTIRTAGVWLAALLSSGCGAGYDDTTNVYASRGSLQCAGGGTPIEAMAQQLSAAGIQVLSSTCGTDGVARVAQCGTPDGAIGVFGISAANVGAAEALGFARLSSLPSAVLVACR